MMRAKTLKTDELKVVLAYIAVRRHAARNRTIMLARFLSGMRTHELASLKIGDVIDEDERIRKEIVLSAAQTNGRRARRVFVKCQAAVRASGLCEARVRQQAVEQPAVRVPEETRLCPNTMCQLFLNIYKGCGIKGASSHSGRRTFITNLASKSVSVRVLAEQAGHSSIATTQRYIEVNDEQLRMAVELL